MERNVFEKVSLVKTLFDLGLRNCLPTHLWEFWFQPPLQLSGSPVLMIQAYLHWFTPVPERTTFISIYIITHQIVLWLKLKQPSPHGGKCCEIQCQCLARFLLKKNQMAQMFFCGSLSISGRTQARRTQWFKNGSCGYATAYASSTQLRLSPAAKPKAQ